MDPHMSTVEEAATPEPVTSVSNAGIPPKGVTTNPGSKGTKKRRRILIWSLIALVCAGGLAGGLAGHFATRNNGQQPDFDGSAPERSEIINNQTGVFNSFTARRNGAQSAFSSWIPFPNSFVSAPDVILNLQKINLSPGTSTLGVDTSATNITAQGFTMRVATTKDTVVNEVAGQWMAIPTAVPPWTTEYQTGHFGILSVRERADTGHNSNVGEVFFERPYSTPPRVVVWIHAFDFGTGKGWRLNAFPTNIRGKGFTVNVNAFYDTILYSANVSWVAWPAEEKNVIGNYLTPIVKKVNTSDIVRAGYTNTSFITFNQGVKKRTFPELLMGFSLIDVYKGGDMKMLIENEITNEGVNCTVRSFENVTMWSPKVAWLAAT